MYVHTFADGDGAEAAAIKREPSFYPILYYLHFCDARRTVNATDGQQSAASGSLLLIQVEEYHARRKGASTHHVEHTIDKDEIFIRRGLYLW